MSTIFSLAVGIGTKNINGQWLEVYYPEPLLNPDKAITKQLSRLLNYKGGNRVIEIDNTTCHAIEDIFKECGAYQSNIIRYIEISDRPKLITILGTDDVPTSVPEVYLKLHLLSHRLVKPRTINLENIFSLLPNVAWTSDGAIDLNDLPFYRLAKNTEDITFQVYSVDKFPKMTDYVVPSGVRICDASRVRLGAYLGEGTTVMHEGFVNFNAGTLGAAMVEGRISAGVIVDAHTDLGGGCSIMGTLSGGNDTVISVGKYCLIGANAGLGIPLGNNCTVEAGLYLTSGSKVSCYDENKQLQSTVKALELSHQSNLLFRRNSQTGAIECHVNKKTVALNETLHANQ